jgi:hypothetical protein
MPVPRLAGPAALAYRAHPDYGRLPLVLVAIAPPQDLAGTGSTELVATFTDPPAVLAAVNRLLQPPSHPRQSHAPTRLAQAAVSQQASSANDSPVMASVWTWSG